MSLPSLLLIILFLCFSMCVCTARPFVAVDEASKVQFNISGKIPENVKKHSVESSAVTKKRGIKSIGAMTQRSKPTKSVNVKKLQSSSKQDFPGQVPTKSVVSVSRRVPHKKQDQNPGFYSDYSQPRTRPPSHN
ncbi:hypothetical protein L6164_017634 [Bauhinia variegata]|uniref:Uncharacterized protein n=1 Tax=Bauhinia variegata TaxID=167791 RepID=A0ACB9N8Q4_BAUVA|nr:hypothetical protein L6164_017634 [Bauhinia variegata]